MTKRFYVVYDKSGKQLFELLALEVRPLEAGRYEIELGHDLPPATMSLPEGMTVRLMA
jgi:hypothetical protein